MRLFIAEKPDLAKAIVEGLGGGSRKEGYYDCGTDKVTWCYGHMLQLQEPEEYEARYREWRLADLPIVPIPWQKKPGGHKKEQLAIITHLLKTAESVVHAGDPDEEGQLLVDEILAYTHCTLPVKRLLINDNNVKVVRKALSTLKDNQAFAGLSAAAEARSVGDQVYGYNLTRAYTLMARQAGYSGVLSVGRVQTPILGLVVRRCRAFQAHQKAYYYTVTGQFEVSGIAFPGRYQITESDPVDEKGRLINEAHAHAIAAAVQGKPVTLVSVETCHKTQAAPLPYNLLKLQTDASRKFGFKPDYVKEITQTLREKYKLITYNRSDCEYLSDEQHSDASGVLQAISHTAPVFEGAVQQAKTDFKSRAFNSAKVSAHHAIIPTEATVVGSTLTDAEQKIYLLVARAYIAQFWPLHEYDQTDIVLDVEGYRFTVRAQVTTLSGWRSLYKNEGANEDLTEEESAVSVDVRALKAGERGQCLSATATKMETKPTPLYTMATLLTDLTRVAKYIRDDRLRKLLQEKDKAKAGEHGGIGTPATRDSIIATLFTRQYLTEKGKNIIATQAGEEFYDTLPDQAKYPDMTALWHEQQKSIQAGERDTVSFIQELKGYISEEIERVKQKGLGLKIESHPCPQCQKALRRIKGTKGFFWGCTGYTEGCKYSAEDKDNRPVARPCATVSAQYRCGVCEKGLSRRPAKKKGVFWWSCSGYPNCKQTYFDQKGQPDYAAASRQEKQG